MRGFFLYLLVSARKPEFSGDHDRGWTDAETTQEHWRNLGRVELERMLAIKPNLSRAKNVVLLMGDGMGMPTVTAGRIMRGQKNSQNGESYRTRMEQFENVGYSKTYNIDFQIPDSAATATALLTGVKVKFMTLGFKGSVTYDDCSTIEPGSELESILVTAAKSGKSTGLVTTTRITHATPAAAYSHSVNRWYESKVPTDCKKQLDIAQQLVENSISFNITFGGGEKHFLPETRADKEDLVSRWMKKENRCYINNKDDLKNINLEECESTLGLFNKNHIDYISHRTPDQPNLSEMTSRALDKLEQNESGYVLFVEAGRIDHGHHESRAHLALEEFVEFDETIEMVMNRVTEDTLVIVTADHSHSMVLVGYDARNTSVFDNSRFNGTNGAYSKIQYATGTNAKKENKLNIDDQILNEKDHVFTASVEVPGWDGGSRHAAEDVPIFAQGPMGHLIHGVHEQSYIHTVMSYALCFGDYQHEQHCHT